MEILKSDGGICVGSNTSTSPNTLDSPSEDYEYLHKFNRKFIFNRPLDFNIIAIDQSFGQGEI